MISLREISDAKDNAENQKNHIERHATTSSQTRLLDYLAEMHSALFDHFRQRSIQFQHSRSKNHDK